MRLFGSIFFGVFFIVIFIAYFLLRSLVSLPTDSEALVDALKDAEFHDALVQVVEKTVEKQLEAQGGDPAYTKYVLSKVKPIISTTLPEDWFYETLTSAHSGLVDFIETGEDTTRIDLTERKADLKKRLMTLGESALEICQESGGGEACEEVEQATAAFALYEEQISKSIDKIPDETNLTALLSKSGADIDQLENSKELREAREGLDILNKAKWGGLAALLVLLLIIGAINFTGPARALIAMGVMLVLSGGVYLGTISTVGPMAEVEISKEFDKQIRIGSDPVNKLVNDTSAKVVMNVFKSGYMGSNTAVIVTIVIGFALGGGGIVVAAKGG